MLASIFKWLSPKRKYDRVKSEEFKEGPKHVAVIMDGNGRWAKDKGLPRFAGHREGMKTVKNITMAASDFGISILTLYAFSTENWTRPSSEVDFLMRLPEEFLALELDELIKENVKICILGNEAGLPAHTRKAIANAVKQTQQNTGLILNLALNYGSRSEIIQTIQELANQVASGQLSPEEITEEKFSDSLLTRQLPDPDLLIRTSGEIRLSNFLLWQLAYTELWFCDVFWPDFTREHFIQALTDYRNRGRRFGGLK